LQQIGNQSDDSAVSYQDQGFSMERLANKRKLLTQSAAIMIVICGFIAWLVRAETKPLDQDELKIEIGNLRSFANAAGLLSEQAQSAKVTQTFFQTQTYLLQDKTETSRSSLETANVQPGLSDKHSQSRQLAGQLKSTLDGLSVSFANVEELNRASSDLKRLSSDLEKLEDSLKR
jgi:hypothetical protein